MLVSGPHLYLSYEKENWQEKRDRAVEHREKDRETQSVSPRMQKTGQQGSQQVYPGGRPSSFSGSGSGLASRLRACSASVAISDSQCQHSAQNIHAWLGDFQWLPTDCLGVTSLEYRHTTQGFGLRDGCNKSSKCAVKMCSQNVQLKCAAKMCSTNV